MTEMAPGTNAVHAVHAEIVRHALDRVPLSLIVDDSTPLVNLNYFFLRDRNIATNQQQRWEDVPVAIPEAFTREWAEWCAGAGVKGKFSVVPCPAGIGRIDQGLPLFGQRQLESWLAMCREVIVPNFDITPEMLTHTFVLDLDTLQPLPSRIWEQYEWQSFDDEALVTKYITLACQILANVDLPPEGVTSPGGFGGRVLPLYARITGNALKQVTGDPVPYFFKRATTNGRVETPVWYPDREAGTAVGEIIACVGDWTGSWTGYGEADADRYVTADLAGGRLPEVIAAGDPCVLCSHWQGFYGMHDGDRRGFHVLKTVVDRLRQLDLYGERTQWRRTSDITRYACARELATIAIAPTDGRSNAGAGAGAGDAGVSANAAGVSANAASVSANAASAAVAFNLDLPLRVPDFTLRVQGIHRVQGVLCEGRPLRRVASRRAFASGTYLVEDGGDVLLAYTPQARESSVVIQGA